MSQYNYSRLAEINAYSDFVSNLSAATHLMLIICMTVAFVIINVAFIFCLFRFLSVCVISVKYCIIARYRSKRPIITRPIIMRPVCYGEKDKPAEEEKLKHQIWNVSAGCWEDVEKSELDEG